MYIGNEPRFQDFPSKFFNGDGSAMTVTLDYAPPSASSILVFVAGVRRNTSEYTISGTSLTFTSSVASGTNNVQVVHLAQVSDTVTPVDGSVTTAKLGSDSVTSAKIVDGTIVNADINASAAIDASKTTAVPLSGGTMTGTLITPIIKDYSETVYAGGSSSTSVTLAETNGNVQSFTMTGNCTFTMPSGSGLQAGTSITLILTQDGTGSRTGAFTGVKWAGGSAPTLTTTATSGIDIITFYTFNGGASPVWHGFASGMDMQ